MFSRKWEILAFLVSSSAWAVTLTPTFTQNYCPVVIENNSHLPANSIYFVAHGLDNLGVPCFLVPDPTTGQCTYVYPHTDGTNGSITSSTALSQLPIAQGTAATGTSYLIYLPINIASRAYLSINSPLFIETTSDPTTGYITIGDPSVTTLNDPNFYTLYQDIEFGFGETAADSQTLLYMNVSYVDYFCLPMLLNTYTLGTNTPLIYGCAPYDYICLPAGTPSGNNRGTIINAINNTLLTNEAAGNPNTWSTLGLFYYDSPYTDTSNPSVYLRILAAKNSIGFGTGSSQFIGAANTQLYFPADYTSNSATGPGGVSFMQALYNYYQSITLEIETSISNSMGGFVTYTMSSSSTNLVMDFKTTNAPMPSNMSLDLSQLTTEELLSGGNWNFIALPESAVNNAYVAELSKDLSALFTLGSLPIKIENPPLIDSQAGFASLNLSYFKNPYDTAGMQWTGGPWWNVYDLAVHLQEATNSTYKVPQSSSYALGYGYAYDYDDLLNMSGLIGGFVFQDKYGNNPTLPVACNPCPTPLSGCSPNSAPNSYVIITLEDMGGMAIPQISQDSWSYPVTIGPQSGVTAVSFAWTDSVSGTGTFSQAASNTTTILLTPQPIVNSGNPLTVTFTYNSIPYTYSIDLLHQAVIPTETGFTSIDRKYQAGVQFAITNLNDQGKVPSGMSPNFTITFDSSPPPWNQ